jgi:hypothetical protein
MALPQRTLSSTAQQHLDDHNQIHALMPTGESVVIKTKAGVPADGDFATTPSNGTVAYNTSTNVMYVRVSGSWIAHGGGGGSGYTTVQDESTPLTQRSTLNFLGAGVTATDTGSLTSVTIPGGTTGNLNWINVKDSPYSATGNGTTDDRAAIQAAYDALPNTSSTTNVVGGVLYFPPGRYVIGSPGLNFTAVKPTWILGSNGASTGRSVNRVNTQLISQSGNYALMQLGLEVDNATWSGFRVENLAIYDSSGTNTGAGIWLANSNYSYFHNVAFMNYLAGSAFLQKADEFNPQYTNLSRCNFMGYKYGIRQEPNTGGTGVAFYNSDTEVYGCTFHGSGDNAAIVAGTIGITTYRTLRMFGGAVQQSEIGVQINEGGNKFIGTAFENTGLGGGQIAVDVVAGNNNQLAFNDFAGAYATTKVRIQAAATNTQIYGWPLSGASTNLIDSGVDTLIMGPAIGYKSRRRSSGELTDALAVEAGDGAQMYDTTNNVPVWSDGATWRYATGLTHP